jgi:hypothetical protein
MEASGAFLKKCSSFENHLLEVIISANLWEVVNG